MRRSAATRRRWCRACRSVRRRSTTISRSSPRSPSASAPIRSTTASIRFRNSRARSALKVIQGIWLASNRRKNRADRDVVRLARQYPGRHHVGRRRQRGAAARRDDGRRSRRQHPRGEGAGRRMPVTYADVWEFWLRHREVYDAVDFVTIHILPYWEDFPIRAAARRRPCRIDPQAHGGGVSRQGNPDRRDRLAERRADARGRAAVARPTRRGWCSEVLALAKRENFRVNLIEAYDQPWKRQLEGTVGGYWGVRCDATRAVKFPPGRAASPTIPFWKLQWRPAWSPRGSWCSARRRDAAPRPWIAALAAWIGCGYRRHRGRHPARRRRRQGALKAWDRRLAALGRRCWRPRGRRADALRQRADVRTGVADLPGTAGAARYRTRSVLTLLLGPRCW